MTVRYKHTSLKSTNVRLFILVRQKLTRILFLLLWACSETLCKSIVKRCFFRPVPSTLSEGQKEVLTRATAFSFESGGKTLKGYQWGRGPAVLFVHGWAGRGAQFYRYVSSLTEKGYSVLTFDHTGHGDSDGKTASYFAFSNAVYDFFQACRDADVCMIIGHSLGASAVIHYLWRTRRKVDTVLIAPALDLQTTLVRTFRRYGVPEKILKGLIRELGMATGHCLETENPVDLLYTLTHDILIVHDTEDRAVPYSASWDISLLQSNLSLFPTKGLGHIRILKDKALIDHIVTRLTLNVT